MKKWLYLLLSALILAAATFLRIYHLADRAPFDWDQNRDYQVINAIASGKPTLIGPVAKGEGGFFLGPLYYYLALPTYLLTDSNPLSLPITSVIIDILTVFAILFFLPRIWGSTQTLLLATFWSFSWFAIESARISWNVSMIPLWSIAIMVLLALKRKYTPILALSLGVVLGLSWHIHASLIPLSVIFLIFFSLRKIGQPTLSIYSVLGYLLPLIPLVIFDIRHSGLERNLIWQFFTASAISTPPWPMVLESVAARFGKNIYAIFTGYRDLHLNWGIFVVILSGASLLWGSRVSRISAFIVVLNLILVIYLREISFPEYYLTAAYLPTIIIGIDLLFRLGNFGKVITLGLVALFIYTNLSMYATEITPFSLTRKNEVAQAIASLGSPVDLRFDLPLGRDSGIIPLLKLHSVPLSPSATVQVVITESTADSLFIDAEIVKDLGRFGGLRVGYRTVQ